MATLTLGMIHRELFSHKKSEGRSATVFYDKTVVHCNYPAPCILHVPVKTGSRFEV